MASKVWYILIDRHGQIIPSRLQVSPEDNVQDLKTKIAEENDYVPGDPSALNVYRCQPPFFPNRNPDLLAEQVSKAFSEQVVRPLFVTETIEELELQTQEFLLVRPRLPISEDRGVLDSDLFKKYDDIFIKVGKWEAFHYFDIDLNDIREATTSIPEFVTDFQEKLDRKPSLPRNSLTASETAEANPQSWTAYFGYPSGSEGEPHDERSQLRRAAECLEVSHYRELASRKWHEYWSGHFGHALKESLADAIFFLPLKLQAPKVVDIDVAVSTTPWPVELIMKCDDGPSPPQLRRYKPMSDFRISKWALPRLLVEVDSYRRVDDNWPPDKIRMLLTGASMVRFANTLDAFRTKNFVLVAMFIRFDGRATQYTLFQRPDDPAVYYRETVFSLSDPSDRVKFMCQLYNLLAILKNSEEGKSTKVKLGQLGKAIHGYIKKFSLKSLHTRKTGGNKRKRTTDDSNGGDSDSASDVGDAADYAELSDHGYDVEPEVTVDEAGGILEPFFQMPSHIRIVYRRPDHSKELIAKKIRPGSKELEILELIRNSRPQSEHIISLLDSFSGRAGWWGILPRIPDSLAHYLALAPTQLRGNVVQVCWGLIKGLAYLHERCIAHRDIKPDNLLIDQDFCLKIIDFDVALQVKDEDEEVSDYCGTEGWIAPEVEKKSPYSPIKADRWSCGRVLLHLINRLKGHDTSLRAAAVKLNAYVPQQRPSLLEWHSWVATQHST